MNVNRPWGTLGIGWLIAIVVIIFCILALVTTVTISNLAFWLILALAIALVIG